MVKIYLDSSNLKTSVVSKFDSSITYLEKVKTKLLELKCPDDFEYLQQIKQLYQNNESDLSCLKSIRNSLNNIILNYSKVQKENTNVLNEFKIGIVPERIGFKNLRE